MFVIFTSMLNECVRLGLEGGDFSYEGVKRACHARMGDFPAEEEYRISAMYEASNLLKKFQTDSKKRKVNRPYCRNPYLAVSLGISLQKSTLTLPSLGPLPLTPHSIAVLSQQEVSIISVTLTPTVCSVIYRKSVRQIAPRGALAVDLNLDNVTTYDTKGASSFYDLKDLTMIHETYRRVKSRFRRNDRRVRKRLFRKYADIEWNRKSAILHRISSQIVGGASVNRQGIVLEDLRGLREMYTRSSGSSRYYLSKMNAWPFRQLLRQIAYKAEWVGLPVCVVSPEWTSEKCSDCGGQMERPPVEDNTIVCLACGLVIDRDVNGAKNILKRGLRSVPVWSANEAMVGGQAPGRGPNAKVDADNPQSHPK